MTEREKLASQLHDIYIKEADKQGNTRNARRYEDLTENVKEYDRVLADFILQDRARIVQPLVKYKKRYPYNNRKIKCIDQTLSNAGVL